jgi:chromosome segregation ATPase
LDRLRRVNHEKEETILREVQSSNRLTQEIAALKAELESRHSSSLQTEQLTNEIATLRAQLARAEVHRKRESKLRKENARLGTLLSQTSSELEEVKATVRQKTESYSSKLAELLQLIDAAEHIKADLLRQVASLKSENSQLTNEKQKLTEHSQAFSASFHRLKKQFEAAASVSDDLRKQIDYLKLDVESKTKQISSLEIERDSVVGENRKLAHDVARLRRNQQSIETELTEKDEELRQFQSMNEQNSLKEKGLLSTIESLKTEFASRQDDYQRQLKACESRLESAVSRCSFLEQKIEILNETKQSSQIFQAIQMLHKKLNAASGNLDVSEFLKQIFMSLSLSRIDFVLRRTDQPQPSGELEKLLQSLKQELLNSRRADRIAPQMGQLMEMAGMIERLCHEREARLEGIGELIDLQQTSLRKISAGKQNGRNKP